MFFKTLATAFFIEHGSNDFSLEKLLTLARMESLQYLSKAEKLGLGINDPNQEVIYGVWNAFGDAWARLDRLEYHNCLQIYFSQDHFLDLIPNLPDNQNLPLEEDPLLPLAYTFRDACEKIPAEVAFVDTHAHYGDEAWENKQGNKDWIINYYLMLLELNVNALADERFGLLYLNYYMNQLWDSNTLRDDRDMIPISEGRLVFAGRGTARWL
ncbi:hypothetical protein H6G33_12205 [Calothrix sp. FACHB-1219]|uniref:hypothetical protein n=1 Tax=unclassified Calothrix TaxID=2619626 RepID=UPI001684CEDD|nr:MULTISPECIES: hypothetical protein [unclassified Calothrix]MBD2202615.1 hypothetical protein [Calothrix sp. FACHB-168]MBD2217795.1 hypothetical protein [Calothrix sp. FACHB-1219]